MASRLCILAMELEDIEREKFDRSLAKRQIHQYFPPSINCAIRYIDLHGVQLNREGFLAIQVH